MLKRAIKLIKKFEGCELKAYQDIAGVWTIGYGRTNDVSPDMEISKKVAEEWLKEDITHAAHIVDHWTNTILQPYERSALISFVYNVGSQNYIDSTLLAILDESDSRRDRIRAAAEFTRWIWAGGKDIKGLLLRRQAEQRCFLFGVV